MAQELGKKKTIEVCVFNDFANYYIFLLKFIIQFILGINLAAISNEITGRQSNNAAADDKNYGALGTICKIVKRGGDFQLFFSLLYLLLDGNIFGNKKLVKRYCPFPVRLHVDRIRKLLPMLFMCKFDPTAKIRELMRKLWDTVVAPLFEVQVQTSVAVQNEIIKFLITSLGNYNWRERETACLALDSYLVLRSWHIIFPYLTELWSLGLRAIDDLRESTKLAALSFMKTLSKQILRACDLNENSPSTVQANIDIIMPLVLDKGLLSSCAEGKAYSFSLLVDLITKVINKKFRFIDKWIIEIIGIMTESMSALEPQTLQYLQFHQSRLQITGNELENVRIQLVNNSPMQQILQACLQNITGDFIPQAAEKLCMFLQRGVGFPSRYSAAQSISLMVELHPSELKKVSGSKSFGLILDTVLSGQNINQTMYRSFVSALGALAKIVEIPAVVEQCRFLIDSYLNISRDDDSRSILIATCLREILVKSAERLNDLDLFRHLASIGT
jgi:proteasome component ECM29